jgi:hypothetical protein
MIISSKLSSRIPSVGYVGYIDCMPNLMYHIVIGLTNSL